MSNINHPVAALGEMTKAQRAALELRARRYVPEGALPVKAKDIEAVAYVYERERNGKTEYLAIAYGGKRSKPDWHYRFASLERRAERITEWMEGLRQSKASVRQRRKEQFGGHSLEVGDVMYASWGYDQTNVNFYRVVEKRGKTMVKLVPIQQATVSQHTTSESVVATDEVRDWDVLLGVESSDEDKGRWKRASGDSVSFDHCSAYKWDGRAKHQTAFGFGH